MCNPISFVTTKDREVLYLQKGRREEIRKDIKEAVLGRRFEPPMCKPWSLEAGEPLKPDSAMLPHIIEPKFTPAQALSMANGTNFDSHTLICSEFNVPQNSVAAYEADLVAGEFRVDTNSGVRDEGLNLFTKDAVDKLDFKELDILTYLASKVLHYCLDRPVRASCGLVVITPDSWTFPRTKLYFQEPIRQLYPSFHLGIPRLIEPYTRSSIDLELLQPEGVAREYMQDYQAELRNQGLENIFQRLEQAASRW